MTDHRSFFHPDPRPRAESPDGREPVESNHSEAIRKLADHTKLTLDAARCYGAKGFTLLRRVVLPASIPNIITGMRIGLGGAWRMIVAAEMLASQAGIGSVLTEARYQFRAADLMMAMILISIIGYITERIIVGSLERRTIQRWDAIPAR